MELALKETVKSKIQDFKRMLAQRSLEAKLARIMETMRAHEVAGRKQGDDCYRELWRLSDTAVDEFCNTYAAARVSIDAQLPGLRKLFELAQPPKFPYVQVFGAIGAVIFALFLIGIAGSVVHWGYQLLAR